MPKANFPILSRGRLDYVDGTYDVLVNRASSGGGMLVSHKISGRNLVSDLLNRSKAAFAVEVSSPYATYRQIRSLDPLGEIEQSQEVLWEDEDVVEPVYVRPLVIAVVEKPKALRLNGRHGVHRVWQGLKIRLEAGSILATDQFWRSTPTFQSLIRLVSDEGIPAGSYRVETSTAEGFYFRVLMNPKLFEWMVSPGERVDHSRSILTGCLSRGLEMVRSDFAETWREYPVLRALHGRMIDSGLQTWEDEGFRPDEVATQLKPIEFTAD